MKNFFSLYTDLVKKQIAFPSFSTRKYWHERTLKRRVVRGIGDGSSIDTFPKPSLRNDGGMGGGEGREMELHWKKMKISCHISSCSIPRSAIKRKVLLLVYHAEIAFYEPTSFIWYKGCPSQKFLLHAHAGQQGTTMSKDVSWVSETRGTSMKSRA